MIFNSIHYLIFLLASVILFYLINYRYRWILLLSASYYFYMCWKPEFIFLIVLVTFINYRVALLMSRQKEKKYKRKYLFLSLISGLGMLFFFKYFNFFGATILNLLQHVNIFYSRSIINIVIPLGISFYTFQTLGYIIDVYQGRKEPEKHFGIFAVYVSFFPLILSGPIERSKHLMPQLQREDKVIFKYENISQGVRYIIYGFFLKLVVAERAAIYVNAVFSNIEKHSGLTFIVAIIFYSFQIYCDFAGYSSVAIGSAKLMGIDILKNFNRPYLATSIKDFWRRWHISLSTWIRDYLFLPLAYSLSRKLKKEKYGGLRADKIIYTVSILVTFFLCGLWHGANITFIIWGCLHGLYLALENLLKIKVKYRLLNIGYTYILILFSWIFFRSDSISHSFLIIKKIFTLPGRLFIGEGPDVVAPIYGVLSIILLIIIELQQEFLPTGLSFLKSRLSFVRILAYATIIVLIVSIGVFDGGQFIYSQF